MLLLHTEPFFTYLYTLIHEPFIVLDFWDGTHILPTTEQQNIMLYDLFLTTHKQVEREMLGVKNP